MIIRSSHQTDTVIKSEDIKKILSDDFTPIHCGFKKCILNYSILVLTSFWKGSALFFRSTGIAELLGYKLQALQ